MATSESSCWLRRNLSSGRVLIGTSILFYHQLGDNFGQPFEIGYHVLMYLYIDKLAM
jgi:hypothetical protein